MRAEPERGGVGARDFERGRRHVGGDHLPAGPLARERERDRPAARAEIRHAPLGRLAQRERALHQQLGLRTRHQHRRGDREAQRPEIAPAGEIGERLAGGAPLEQVPVLPDALRVDQCLGMGLQPRARDLQDMGEEELGVQSGAGARLDTHRGTPQPLRALG